MTTPIHDQLAAEHQIRHVRDLWHHLTSHPPRHGYHAGSSSTPEGPAMTLDEIRTDLQNGAHDLVGKAEDFLATARTFAEQHVGQLESIQLSAPAQAIESFVLGPADEAFLTKIVQEFGERYGTPKGAAAAPAADEPPAPAMAAGPTVAGTAG